MVHKLTLVAKSRLLQFISFTVWTRRKPEEIIMELASYPTESSIAISKEVMRTPTFSKFLFILQYGTRRRIFSWPNIVAVYAA